MGSKSERKQHFLQNKEKHSNNKETYTDESKAMGKKVGFAVVYGNITRRGILPEEASIDTAEMTAIKKAVREIEKIEDKRWLIYTDSLKSLLVIKNNGEKSCNIKSDI